MHPDPGRARQTRREGLGDHDPHAPSSERTGSGSPPIRSNLERVPQVAGARDPGARLLHRRDGVALHAVRTLRDPRRIPSGARPRGHPEPRLGVGEPAGSEPRHGGAAHGDPVRDPRPRLEVSGPFDEVFLSQDIQIVKTPIRAPRANALAERWVRTVRTECLDWMLVFGRRHLEQILRIYAGHYNRRRPHRGIGLATPEPQPDQDQVADGARVRRCDLLGGHIHEYELAA